MMQARLWFGDRQQDEKNERGRETMARNVMDRNMDQNHVEYYICVHFALVNSEMIQYNKNAERRTHPFFKGKIFLL
jgi:hypothetical protein